MLNVYIISVKTVVAASIKTAARSVVNHKIFHSSLLRVKRTRESEREVDMSLRVAEKDEAIWGKNFLLLYFVFLLQSLSLLSYSRRLLVWRGKGQR